MHIVELSMTNWLPFGGKTKLNLTATNYAVIASTQGDFGRSNWVGKTAFFEAPVFAIYGDHRKRTEDEWITTGEDFGSVELLLSSGDRICRSRKRGESTRVTVCSPTGITKAGTEAEQYIESVVGLTKDDYYSMSHFKQRKLSEIVTMDASERSAKFAHWLRLERLGEAEKLAAKSIQQIKSWYDDANKRTYAVAIRMARYLGDPEQNLIVSKTIPEMADYIRKGLATLEANREIEKERLDSAQISVDLYFTRASEAKDSAAIIARAKVRDSIRDELVALRNDHAPESPFIDQKLLAKISKTTELVGTIRSKLKSANELCRGEFDGVCPVNGCECPKTEAINADNEQAALVRDKAKGELLAANTELKQSNDEAELQRNVLNDWNNRLSKIVALNKQFLDIKVPDKLPTIDETGQRNYEEARRALTMASAAHSDASNICEEMRELWKEIESLLVTVKGISDQIAVYQAAQYIFSKQGAQRRIAERVMRSIENDGNSMLRSVGIDLTFQLAWSRKGQGLAVVCSKCGASFPKSERVKRCTCGAERGPLIIDKSEVLLSDQSGAAEDMAGGVIRLATSSWFRTARQAQWAVALIDEPFGALDESNRENFSRLLRAMLSERTGIEQSFVTAHNPEVLAELPSTIRLIRNGRITEARIE